MRMQMRRVNITIPEELIRRARAADLNVSKVCREAIVLELERLAKIAAVDEYLAELEARLGPISPEDQARADELVRRTLSAGSEDRQTA